MVRKAVIPAAGLGTRFLPATKAQPKEMLPVVDKPAIQYVVEEAVRAGIDDILIITGRGKRSLEDHFDRTFELETTSRRRQAETAIGGDPGASPSWPTSTTCARASRWASATPCRWPASTSATTFVVMLGDDIMDERVARARGHDRGERARRALGHRAQGVPACRDLGVRLRRDRRGLGPARARAHPRHRREAGARTTRRRTWRSWAATCSRPTIFDVLERCSPGVGGEIQLTDAIALLLEREAVYGYTFTDGRYDIGNKLDYLRATVELALEREDLGPGFRHVPRRARQARGSDVTGLA